MMYTVFISTPMSGKDKKEVERRLIDISRKKIPADSIEQIILSKNRFAAGYTAPARGLYLNKIHY